MPKKGNVIDKDHLGTGRWLLDRLHDVLHSFCEATLCSDGKQDHLGQWFITMDWLLNEAWTSQETFRQLKGSFPDREEYSILAAASVARWTKVEQYYKLADVSPAYYGGIALQPNVK